MSITALLSKQQILEDAGYSYSFDREIYVNRSARKVFSVEFVEDHAEDELQRCIQESTPAGGWQFYFNTAPSDAVRRELESLLG
jgi:hypothetical protein